MKQKIIGTLLLIIGVITGILGIVMLIGSNKGAGLIKEAIYVDESTLQAENDGKLVIVTGDLNLLESAFDSELGITFDSPKVVRNMQNIKWVKNLEVSRQYDVSMYGWEWANLLSENNVYYGKAMVREFKLSENLLKNFPTPDTYRDYDELELNKAQLTLIEDTNYTQKYFLEDLVWQGPEDMGYYYEISYNPKNYDDVIRYYYYAYLPKNHDGITVIGIQNGDTLDLHEDLSQHSFMSGTLTQNEVMEQFQSTNMVGLITCIVISLGCLIIGSIFVLRR